MLRQLETGAEQSVAELRMTGESKFGKKQNANTTAETQVQVPGGGWHWRLAACQCNGIGWPT